MFEEAWYVEPLLVDECPVHVGYGDHPCSPLVKESRQVGADISESLNDHAAAVDRDVEVAPELLHDVHHAAARRLLASE